MSYFRNTLSIWDWHNETRTVPLPTVKSQFIFISVQRDKYQRH